MKIITLDFESFYDDEYSLSKMQTDAYILDPRFEVIGVSVKYEGGPAEWFSGTKEEIAAWLNAIGWSDKALLCHHTAFDAFILTQVFDTRPAFYLDTLSMFRALQPWQKSVSLASMSQILGLPPKGTEVVAAKGKRRRDFTPEELRAYGEYCKNDGNITRAAFDIMLKRFPAQELGVIDQTIRMFVEPQLALDEAKLTVYREGIVAAKEKLQQDSGFIKDVLMSNDKFAEALMSLGIDPPMKVSKRTKKLTYAFAKTDEDFTALAEHEDSRVQALVAARLGNKSTIAETRAQKFIETAQRGRGFPVYLNYWGARVSGRDSGGNAINSQNLPNRGKDRTIREAIIAPPGMMIVVGDSANIELRTNMVMAGQDDVVQKIREYDAQGSAAVSDLYCDFATEFYGKPVGKSDKLERTVGKVAMLSLGYGASAEAFRRMLFAQAGLKFPLADCESIVALYRERHDKVKKLWNYCGDTILPAINNANVLIGLDKAGWLYTTDDGFAIPGLLGVHYKNLRRNNEGEWEYNMGRETPRIYGAKVVENMSQHAARQIVMWQALRFGKRYREVVLRVHDEIVACVPEKQAEDCAAYLLECLRTAPPWAENRIPLNGEVGIGKSYAEAK